MHPGRRRKKRPNYGIRTVEVMRGPNGFGFTISGQQPCILSCIVANSPAEQAGLRAGDFLISVNGMSVSKSTHDSVVNLIGSSVGPIKMSIAENYYSDSSDEENDMPRFLNNRKPRHLHRAKGQRNYKSETSKSIENVKFSSPLKKLSKTSNGMTKSQQGYNCADKNGNSFYQEFRADYVSNVSQSILLEESDSLAEYKALVGYLGTIEMPKQLQPNSRLQTVCSCIRKLRQEKRTPTLILMTILPTCLTLKNSSNQILAIYPSNRVVYIGSMTDKDSRYFGLVTSAICSNNSTETVNEDSWDVKVLNKDSATVRSKIEISNSCHVFVADPKLAEHNVHLQKAEQFNISCTKDIITGNCLEFPKSAFYIVALVKNIFKLQDSTTDKNNGALTNHLRQNRLLNDDLLPLVANSPQPSASSNSDSGIGYRDDCGNVSDRILIVEFPVQKKLQIMTDCNHSRPSGIDASVIPLANLDFPLNNGDSFISQSKTSDINGIRCTNNIEGRTSSNLAKTINIDNQIGNEIKDGSNEHQQDKLNYNLNNIRAVESSYSWKQNCLDSTEQKYSAENDIHQDYKKDCNRFSVRAMPNPKNLFQNHQSQFNNCKMQFEIESYPEYLADTSLTKKSYESVSSHSVNEELSSVENLSVHSLKDAENVFKVPTIPYFDKSSGKKQSKGTGSYDNLISGKSSNPILKCKLSPKVYSISKPNYSCEELSKLEPIEMNGYSSLQNLSSCNNDIQAKRTNTRSEPDVRLDMSLDDENGLHNTEQKEGPSTWATSFEKLLEDPLGLQSFAAFLKKEFSAENIYFWTACERYRRVLSPCDRVAEAQRIYNRHLCSGAPEPVNVDSQGRQITEQSLQEAHVSLFDEAQKQIFNLMKFDSYPRFLKSDIYKQCLSGKADSHFDASLLICPTTITPTKLKKSLSNAEDRRRKSLLPWHRKNRSKSKDRGETEYNQKKENTNGSDQSDSFGRNSDVYSSRSSLISQESGKLLSDDASLTGRNPLCRVILSNGSTTVVQIKQAESIEELINRVLEKRGISYTSYEVMTDKHLKPLDIHDSSIVLSGCEVRIQQRVVFKLYLPNKKVIAVKSKHSKILVDVLKPILNKYEYKLEQVVVTMGHESVDIFQPVTIIEGMKLNIQLRNEEKLNDKLNRVPNKENSTSMETVANRVFKDILNEKSDPGYSKVKSDQDSLKSDGWDSEHSSGIFSKLIKKDVGAGIHEKKKKTSTTHGKIELLNNTCEDLSSEQIGAVKRPLIAKWKTGANKLHLPSPDSDELYEGLKRAQRSRLEDQRGTEINFELPDFLKDKGSTDLDRRKLENQIVVFTSNQPSPSQTKTAVKENSAEESNTYYFGGIFNNKGDNFKIFSPSISNNMPSMLKSSNEKTSEAENESYTINRPSEPPPLPPKPKIVPSKPSNWGQNGMIKYPLKLSPDRSDSSFYLEQPTSSFV